MEKLTLKKNENWEKRARLGTKKWGILKYLSAEIFTENQSRMAYECIVKRHVSVTS